MTSPPSFADKESYGLPTKDHATRDYRNMPQDSSLRLTRDTFSAFLIGPLSRPLHPPHEIPKRWESKGQVPGWHPPTSAQNDWQL